MFLDEREIVISVFVIKCNCQREKLSCGKSKTKCLLNQAYYEKMSKQVVFGHIQLAIMFWQDVQSV